MRPERQSPPAANQRASNVIDLQASIARRSCCQRLSHADIAEASRRELYCDADGRCAADLLRVEREFDLLEHQVLLRYIATEIGDAWNGVVAAALRDHADLLEVAAREGWHR